MKTQKGITLIALIVTIIVMLILVGVSISVTVNTGLFKTAQDVAKNTQAEMIYENEHLASGNVIYDILKGSGVYEDREGLYVGSQVEYTPDQGTYSVAATYTGATEKQTFTTETGANALKWRVLHIYKDGSMDIISENYATQTLTLGGAIGYNNGVDILNDLCKELYSNESLGAEARSMQVSDFNKKTGYTETSIKDMEIGTETENKRYPAILKDEKGMIINGKTGELYSKNSKLGNGVKLSTGEYTYTAYENDGIVTADSLSGVNTFYKYYYVNGYGSSEQTYPLIYNLVENVENYDTKKLMRPEKENRGVWLADRCVAFTDEGVKYGLFTNDPKYNLSRLTLFYSNPTEGNQSEGKNVVTSAYRPVVHIGNTTHIIKPGQTVATKPIEKLEVGDIVYYDEDENGTGEKYIVMYNTREYGCQIISAEYKKVIIGTGDKTKSETGANITDGMRENAQDLYNDIVSILNEEATKYLNTNYGAYARALGCDPKFGTGNLEKCIEAYDTPTPTEMQSITYPGVAGDVDSTFLVDLKPSDLGYMSDKDVILQDDFKRNIEENGIYDKFLGEGEPKQKKYLYASRQIIEEEGKTQLLVRGYNGVFWEYRDNVETVAVCRPCNIYPIITLRPDVIVGTTGTGTFAEPYTLEVN